MVRECLGWLTTCNNDQSCPQNWLEHAVTELPLTALCHVCGVRFNLVGIEKQFRNMAREGRAAAFPVIAPIAIDPEWRPPAPKNSENLTSLLGPSEAGTNTSSMRLGRYEWLCTMSNGATIRVDRETMIIGRSRTCDIVVPSTKISRQHAKLSFIEGDLWIEDLGSANGVWHNGDKIQHARVGNGDAYTISDETLLFEVEQ